MHHSKRCHEGYLLIDHSQSPGTPIVPAGTRHECPTITCAHCGNVVILNPLRTRPRSYCARCDHYICDQPGCVVDCHPFAQHLDEVERQHRLLIARLM